MPTMSKLVAFILMAGLGYLAADFVAGHLPPERPAGSLRIVALLVGAMIGWRFLGKRAGDGYVAAMGYGLSAVASMVIVCLGIFSGYEMIRRSMRLAYGGNPIEALEDMFAIAIDFTQFLAHVDVIGVLIAGGAIVGLLVEATSRRAS